MHWAGRLWAIVGAAFALFFVWFFGVSAGCQVKLPTRDGATDIFLPLESPVDDSCTARDLSFRRFTSHGGRRGALSLCEDEGIGVCFVWTCTSRTA